MFNGCRSREKRTVSLLVDDGLLDSFSTLLQSGVFFSCQQGESIEDLLVHLPGFSKEYITTRLQTVFLNGLPADDLGQPIFGTEATLALSAAMPGLAGAIFRKGGAHSSLRTLSATALPAAAGDDFVLVRIKLFNMVAKERGRELLGDSCRIMASSLVKFLAYRPTLSKAVRTAEIDGRELNVRNLVDLLKDEKMIDLRIRGSYGS